MNITVEFDLEQRSNGFPTVHLNHRGSQISRLDIEWTKLIPFAQQNEVSLDFLILATVVYALDKLVPRRGMTDGWTRTYKVRLPVANKNTWQAARTKLESCLSFLTGDIWGLEFGTRENPLIEAAQIPSSIPALTDVICLFSGGLDSLVGAIDCLEEIPPKNIVLVGHHDGSIAGPLSDQQRVLAKLSPLYPLRAQSELVRVGNTTKSEERTFRSRSLLFLALGIYVASGVGSNTRLLMPENGTIALNIPLTASRRGSCSTRTAHPYFLSILGEALPVVGISNTIHNPLAGKTKGEAVAQCKNQEALREMITSSVSCAKRGHKMNWINRTATSCGCCMPCIYRRAALHSIGLDNETYGRDICSGEVDVENPSKTGPRDLRACLSFLRHNYQENEIERMLIASGSLDMAQLHIYAKLVVRAMDEIRHLLRDKGTQRIRELAGI